MTKHITFIFLLLPILLLGQSYLPIIKDGKWGVIDSLGNKVALEAYSGIKPFFNNKAPVSKKGKWGLVSIDGELLIDFIYSDLEHVYNNDVITSDFFKAKMDEEYALVTKDNKVLTPFIYDEIRVYGNNFIAKVRSEGYRLGDIEEGVLTDDVFRRLKFKDGVFIGEQKKIKKIMSPQAEVIEEGMFINVSGFEKSLLVDYRSHLKLITRSGEEMVARFSKWKKCGLFYVGYDHETLDWFMFHPDEDKVTRLGSYELVFSFSNFFVFRDAFGDLIIRDENGKQVSTANHIHGVFENYLWFAKQEKGFIEPVKYLYNDKMERVAREVTNFFNLNDEYYVVCSANDCGLAYGGNLILPMKYRFFELSGQELRAYTSTSLTVYTIDGSDLTEEVTYNNVYTVNDFTDVNTNNNIQFSWGSGASRRNPFVDIEWFRNPIRDTSGRVIGRSNWGCRDRSDTSQVYTKMIYESYQNFVDKNISIGNHPTRQRRNVMQDKPKLVMHIPYISTMDIIDHENRTLLNPRKYYNISQTFSNGIKLAHSDKTFYVLNSDFEVIHTDIPYVDFDYYSDYYRFCTLGEGVQYFDKYSKPKNAIKTSDWWGCFRMFWYDVETVMKEDKEVQPYITFKEAKWGVMRSDGEIVIPAEYDYIAPQYGGFFTLHKGFTKGVAKDGELILDPIYTSISYEPNLTDTLIIAGSSKAQSNYLIDSLGNPSEVNYAIVSSPKLNKNPNYITAKKEDKYGVLNRKNEFVVPFVLSNPPLITDEFMVYKERKFGVMDLNGNKISEPIFTRIKGYKNGVVVYISRNKLAVAHVDGEPITPPMYDAVFLDDEVIRCKKGYQTWVYDYNGELLSNEKWSTSDWIPKDDIWLYRRKRHIKVKTKEKRFKVKGANRSVRFVDDYLCIEHKKGKYQLHALNKDLHPVLSNDFEKVNMFHDSLFQVTNNRKTGVYNKKDKEIIPCVYRELVPLYDGIYGGISKGVLVVYNLKGDTLFTTSANEVHPGENGYFLVKSNDGCRFFNTNFENVYDRTFDNAMPFVSSYTSVAINGFWTVINSYGEQLFEPSFGKVTPITTNIFHASEKRALNVFNDRGEAYSTVGYDQVTPIGKTMLKLVRNGVICYLTVDGEMIYNVFE